MVSNKKVFREGYDAAEKNWDPKYPDDLTHLIRNPYINDKELHTAWQAGWNWYVTLETPEKLHIKL